MATFNSPPNILNNTVKTSDGLQSTAGYFVPSAGFAATAAIENHSYIGMQKNLANLTHVNSSSSYTFMEIKREPCQVSEVTTSNCLQSSIQDNSKSLSSTMTTMVKIESTSPKVSEMEKVSQINSNNSVPVGIALARKRPQETTLHSTAMQPPRDMNYFGIRVADLGGVATAGCGNIYFAGTDLLSGASTEDMTTSIHTVNRSGSTFWQYPNTFPMESVISMSPVGLQYSRDSRQLVLLPTTATMDSLQQAAFLWPSYMQQNSSGALQSPPNFIFPSMSPQTNPQSQSFSAPLQLLGSSYLTAAAEAATSTFCQHSQTNGNRFVSISSDTKKIEQSQRQAPLKIEDWSGEHNMNKSDLISHHVTASRMDKSKADSESNYFETQTNASLVGTMPMLPYEAPHILLHSTPPPSEFINMPINQSNFIASQDATQLTQSQITQDVNGGMLKNSGIKASFPKTPEMQDVNIQTDTPVCSEDENSLEVSTIDNMSCNIQLSERNKSITCKALLKDNTGGSEQLQTACNDFSKDHTPFAVRETCSLDSELISNRIINKNECFNSEAPSFLPTTDRCENSSFKSCNPSLLEMSGLELLSNISTGSFVNHNSLKTVCVKQEPCENVENEHASELIVNYESYPTDRSNLKRQYLNHLDEKKVSNTMHSVTQSSEQSLGGLNLLCALAEQRIQEEVDSIKYNNISNATNADVRRKKHKHVKTKSGRRKRYYKKNKKKYANERKEYLKASELKLDCDDVHENVRGSFKKADTSYKKVNKWRNPEDFFKAMESDMRMRLADITRQYRKKKRKLDEISRTKKKKKTSSTEYKFANISCKNPNFICFLDKFQSTPSNFPPASETSENQHITIHKKKSDCAVEIREDFEPIPLSERVHPLKLNTRTPSHNTILAEKLHCSVKKDKRKKRRALESEGNDECQQQAEVIKPDNNFALKIDKELVLSNEHLYRKETRVLTDMGGLFYAGILKPLQPPDVYAITLDGERGNKSHIMSREEIFKDAILEVAPKSIENVPTGTRLCAYWSQQYRCLYPGKAIDSETPDIGSNFVSVEFDDGDSGRISLQNIRFLLSDYPIVEYSENPFNTLGKNKRSAAIKYSSTDTVPVEPREEDMREPFTPDSNHDSFVQKIHKKKNQCDKNVSTTSNISECGHKHRKHKKRKKHKKHHRRSSPKMSTAVSDSHHEEGETEPIQGVENPILDFDGINNKELKQNNCEGGSILNTKEVKKRDGTLLGDNMKSTAIGLDDEDSTSNLVSETADEVKPKEKLDNNIGKGSKIAPFLPERQLWGWLGQTYRKAGLKGRARKQFYKSITRGKEIITVGECAVFLSTGRPDRPYIGRIEAMWETTSSNKVVRVRWFYHPEETTGCPTLKYPGALFDSPHEDENDVQTISHKCEVIEFSVYVAKFGLETKQYQSIYDNNDTYYLSGYYNPRLQVLKLQPDIPIKQTTSV